ncbi:MAG: orotidine-5'-phosphate decarboxylase [Dehalococcoidales bacterium]|nr:orotidine-5'-phosphate decarboxylase [Dehalococcoidales bacterium]
MNFVHKLTTATRQNDSLLCIGLDPDVKLMPAKVGILEFNREIIAATRDLVCAYKLNLAFYEALGAEGCDIMKATLESIPDNIPVIADGKRGDIGNTSKAYATGLFDVLGFDAATVNPYMGYDSLEPFIDYWDKGIFVVCRTSNPGSADFQMVSCQVDGQTYRLFELVAARAAEWNKYGNIGLVVGATYPEEIRDIRVNYPSLPLLIPGIGAQGGDLALTVKYGVNRNGGGAIINSSRQIIFASLGGDFAEAARREALALRDRVNQSRTGLSP